MFRQALSPSTNRSLRRTSYSLTRMRGACNSVADRSLAFGFERLESRELLAADLAATACVDSLSHNQALAADVDRDGAVTNDDALVLIATLNGNCASDALSADVNADGSVSPIDALIVIDALRSQPQLVVSDVGEGEGEAIDLARFARSLAEADVVLYGAPWDADTHTQRELFGDAATLLNFVNATNPDRTANDLAIDQSITVYPTWQFADDSRLEGVQSIEQLATQAGLELFDAVAPSVIGLSPTVDLQAGSPLHLPLDGYSADGEPLEFEVTSDNDQIVAQLLTGRTLRFDVQEYGTMTFQLFDEEAPRVADRIARLAESGFYDGLVFHRIIDEFVLQGGDPLGNGTGGSDLPDFDDQFDVDLQHNRTGMLSMAKSSDDTNNSQFFITEGPQRHLDFNHSIFGQLIEGEDVREAISAVPVGARSVPVDAVVIESASVLQDDENGLMRLTAPEGFTGSATISVTVRNAAGAESSVSFEVNAVPDDRNGAPYLEDIEDLTTTVNQPIDFQLVAQDAEGDSVVFDGVAINTVSDVLTVDPQSGLARLEPPTDFVGDLRLRLTVTSEDRSDTSDPTDSQEILVQVLPLEVAVLAVELAATSDSGVSSSDAITSAEQVDLVLSGLVVDEPVELFADGALVQSFVADETAMTISVADLTEGQRSLVVRQVVDGVATDFSSLLAVQIDRTNPSLDADSVPSSVRTGETIDVQFAIDDVTATTIELEGGPETLLFNAETATIVWTPDGSQLGRNSFTVFVTDAAGNRVSQQLDIDVLDDIQNETPQTLDVVALARSLADEGVLLYGAAWDSATTEQRRLFEEGLQYLPFVETTDQRRNLMASAVDQQVAVLPTWVLPDGTRLEGVQTIERLAELVSQASGNYAAPEIVGLPERVNLLAGSPLHLALDGYGLESQGLTYEVSTDADWLRVDAAQGNRSLRFNIRGFGSMTFQLHDDLVPDLTEALVEYVNAGVYDGMPWQLLGTDRMQTGDLGNSGLGTGDVGALKDQFHPDLQHNQAGVLSLAKLVDDGNTSQIFVTHQAKRDLDFHNSIVAQLVEGEQVRFALAGEGVGVGGRPLHDLVIDSVEVIEDTENALLRLAADDGSVGTANVTLAVVDSFGNRREYELVVDAVPDGVNSGPYLLTDEFTGRSTTTSAEVQLASFDAEQDAVRYFARVIDDSGAIVSVDTGTGRVIVQRPPGFTGTVQLIVGVSQNSSAHQLDRFDRELISVAFAENDLFGDIDLSGVVDVNDIDALCRGILSDANDARRDLDADGSADVADHRILWQDTLQLVPGDANLDGVFESADLVQLFQAGEYEDGVVENSVWQTGDWNCDGEFTSADLVVASVG